MEYATKLHFGVQRNEETNVYKSLIGSPVWVSHNAGGIKGILSCVKSGYFVIQPSIVYHQLPNNEKSNPILVEDRPSLLPIMGSFIVPLAEGHLERILSKKQDEPEQLEFDF